MVADKFYNVTIRDEGPTSFRTPVKDWLEAPMLSIQPYYIEYGFVLLFNPHLTHGFDQFQQNHGILIFSSNFEHCFYLINLNLENDSD